MDIVTCDCQIRIEGPGSDISGKGDHYSDPECDIASHKGTDLVAKVRTSLPGGVSYKNCAVEILDGFVNLTCDTEQGETIEFEMVAWELTYSIRFDTIPNLNSIYFMGNKITRYVDSGTTG